MSKIKIFVHIEKLISSWKVGSNHGPTLHLLRKLGNQPNFIETFPHFGQGVQDADAVQEYVVLQVWRALTAQSEHTHHP